MDKQKWNVKKPSNTKAGKQVEQNTEHFHREENTGAGQSHTDSSGRKSSGSNFSGQGKETQVPSLPSEKKGSVIKSLKQFGVLCVAIGLLTFMLSSSPSVDVSESARNALQHQTSTAIAAGSVLLSADEHIGEMDHTITHQSSQDETKIWVWDYAAEDGDFVQILVNGAPITEPFMIKHKPREILVPSVGEVQIKGIRDGGGGITYAVRYELNGTSYFNSAPEGEFNTYTLIRE